MGKVIKGSAGSEERYTLAVPAVDFPAPSASADSEALTDEWESATETGSGESPAAPAVDLEAIYAQAQELVDEATRSAQSLVEDAQARAHAVLEDAAKAAEALGDSARREGHDDGYARGVLDAQAAMTGMIDTFRELVDAARKERHVLLTSAEPELVRLAVGIAERVLHQQIALDRGVVVEMARAAIARIVDREKITVRVNPADLERMREHRDELLALGDVKTMRVIEDQRVDRGGVIVETDAGSIDAKITTQFAEVRKILHIVDDVVMQPALDDAQPPLEAARAS